MALEEDVPPWPVFRMAAREIRTLLLCALMLFSNLRSANTGGLQIEVNRGWSEASDVMSDPVVAADGYTYEAEAIKKWFPNGRTTSPMTDLELPDSALIPNHALCSAIKEWIMQSNDMSENIQWID